MGTVTQWTINGAVYYSPSPSEPDRHLTAIESELMQFTGLLDKNGKEIYEGDIVVFHRLDDEPLEDCVKHIVRWFDSIPGFNTVEPPDVAEMPTDSESLEVIGNVFENPELLDNTSQKGVK